MGSDLFWFSFVYFLKGKGNFGSGFVIRERASQLFGKLVFGKEGLELIGVIDNHKPILKRDGKRRKKGAQRFNHGSPSVGKLIKYKFLKGSRVILDTRL